MIFVFAIIFLVGSIIIGLGYLSLFSEYGGTGGLHFISLGLILVIGAISLYIYT